MNKLRNILCVLLLLCTAILWTGCQREKLPSEEPSSRDSRPSIVCTAFPQYDWTLQILGDRAENFTVTLLNHQGADMHSFQPTAENMVSIANCDLFIHIGGFSESWVPSALESAHNEKASVLTLLDHVDKLEETFTPGMAHDSHHDHDHDHGHDGDEGEPEYDEHLWLSLRCAQDACRAITESICRLDPNHTEEYQKNLQQYCTGLQALDEKYAAAANASKAPILLFADRFPFRYLAADYNIECFAAFPGCSAETEASFETIVALSEELSAHQLHALLLLEGSKPDFAKTIIASSTEKDARILTLNSMQSTNRRDIEAGTTYLSIMEKNLQVLKEALQSE